VTVTPFFTWSQVIQIFDSWAGHLAPDDYDVFAMPYQKMVVDAIKKKHPEVTKPAYMTSYFYFPVSCFTLSRTIVMLFDACLDMVDVYGCLWRCF
jgi:uroporphyrinogen-III decarboxylase